MTAITQVKILRATNPSYLEMYINDWLKGIDCSTIIDIQFTHTYGSGAIELVAYITYTILI